MNIPITENEALIAILDIRAKITECRRQGLVLTAGTLRHQAMTIIESFVDPAWDDAPPELRSGRALAAERVPGVPF